MVTAAAAAGPTVWASDICHLFGLSVKCEWSAGISNILFAVILHNKNKMNIWSTCFSIYSEQLSIGDQLISDQDFALNFSTILKEIYQTRLVKKTWRN